MSRITRKGRRPNVERPRSESSISLGKALQKRYVAKVRGSHEKKAYLPICLASLPLPWSKMSAWSLSSVYQLSTSNYLPDITFRRLS